MASFHQGLGLGSWPFTAVCGLHSTVHVFFLLPCSYPLHLASSTFQKMLQQTDERRWKWAAHLQWPAAGGLPRKQRPPPPLPPILYPHPEEQQQPKPAIAALVPMRGKLLHELGCRRASGLATLRSVRSPPLNG